eukprot:5451012-Karenia_brevis.AAC.1
MYLEGHQKCCGRLGIYSEGPSECICKELGNVFRATLAWNYVTLNKYDDADDDGDGDDDEH